MTYFLALRSPAFFTSRLMGPILPVRLSASIAEPVALNSRKVSYNCFYAGVVFGAAIQTSVWQRRDAPSGVLSCRSVVEYDGGLRIIGIRPEDDDTC
jgi:hypothetical protein